MVRNELSAGDLMSFLVTAQTIQRSLAQFSLVFGSAVKGWASCARIHEVSIVPTSHFITRRFQFLRMQPTNMGGAGRIAYHSLGGDIEFKDVSFNYITRPDHVVLDHFNLKIEAGRKLAICGPSGSGTSSCTRANTLTPVRLRQEHRCCIGGTALRTSVGASDLGREEPLAIGPLLVAAERYRYHFAGTRSLRHDYRGEHTIRQD